MKKYFVTGIGTGVGKTLVSAMLTEALEADYWKPIQAGELESTDRMKVRNLVINTKSILHSEAYKFKKPASPHEAAAEEGISIILDKIKLPESSNEILIIEGAGGLMVPLNEKHLMADLICQLDAEVILVSRHYLGSINHTLLSFELLKKRNIPIKGIVFNGESNPATEEIIKNFTGLPVLFSLPEFETIDKQSIHPYLESIRKTFS